MALSSVCVVTSSLLLARYQQPRFFPDSELTSPEEEEAAAAAAEEEAREGEHVIKVTGMSCGKCVSRVTTALQALPGVTSAHVTLEPPVATVRGSAPLSPLLLALSAAGYPSSSDQDPASSTTVPVAATSARA